MVNLHNGHPFPSKHISAFYFRANVRVTASILACQRVNAEDLRQSGVDIAVGSQTDGAFAPHYVLSMRDYRPYVDAATRCQSGFGSCKQRTRGGNMLISVRHVSLQDACCQDSTVLTLS